MKLGPIVPRVSITKGKNFAPTSLAASAYLVLLVFSLCGAKCPGHSIVVVIVWLREGFGWVIVTSARSVTKSQPVTIRFILPCGGRSLELEEQSER